MRRPFYQWLMTERDPVTYDAVRTFANSAFYDQTFPKQSDNFDEVSRYLEENASYLHSMSVFDEAWNRYLRAED